MTAKIINGEKIARSIRKSIKEKIADLVESGSRQPSLAVLLVGDDPGSQIYVRLKKKDCDQVGIRCDVHRRPSDIPESEVIDLVRELNADEDIDAILIQLPLPKHIDTMNVVCEIDPSKDIDGITAHNMGMLSLRHPGHRACTPKGVMTLIRSTGVEILGTHSVVIGASNHVGRPMGLELLMAGSTVTTAHQFTQNTAELVRTGDIVISATGVGNLVKRDWIKPGAIVIDVGIERQEDGSLTGDVDFDDVLPVAGWLTPVPGGVGPMTRVSLLQNLFDAVQPNSN